MRTKELIFQPEQCRRLLVGKREELISTAAHGELREPLQETVEDQAPVLHQQFVASQVQSLDYQTLRLIDSALERLDTPEYGICQECGEPISQKRLMAVPWAAYCISCQDRITAESANGQRAA